MLLDSFRTQTSCVHIISFFENAQFIYLFIYFFCDLSLKTF